MKRNALLTAALLTAAALAPGAALHAQPRAANDTISTGYWQYNTKFLGITFDKDYRCVGAADVAKFFDGPCNRHHTCTYPVRQVANGKAHYEGYWVNDDGERATVKADGTYTSKRFVLNASGTTTGGLPIRGASIDARWVSDTCPAGAAH